MISEREICESAAENHNRLNRKTDVSNRILDALVMLQLLTELIQLTTAPHPIFVTVQIHRYHDHFLFSVAEEHVEEDEYKSCIA
jgi:hypothetical protein